MTQQAQHSTGEGPFRLQAEFDAAAFREALNRAGYTASGIRELKREMKSNDPIDLVTMDRRTAQEHDPFQTLARLFFLAFEVTTPALRDAIAPVPVEHLVEIGLVRRHGERCRSVARIERHGDLFVCSDFVSFTRGTPLATDHILGVGPGAISLGALTPQSAVESVLDLGTGGGIQALLAAPHAERVVATDLCPRALNFAAMNARLNGFSNIELRAGSFFEPVADERFDRIIANPPFVISPKSRFIFRDGGLGGDAVSEHIARSAAAHLEEGGFAVALLNWHHKSEDDWKERPSSWTRDKGCDVRWMRFDDEDPVTYAASWLRLEEKWDLPTAERMLDEWVHYYQEVGITRIALGTVIMRKRSGRRNWLRCDDVALSISLTACGDQIERIFDAEDLLAELGDLRELLDRKIKLHPAHRLAQELAVREGGWAIQSNMLHVTSGMDFCAQIDMPTMQFLTQLDGTRTVRQAAVPVAEALGRTFEEVLAMCLDTTKRMLRIGLLQEV